MSKLLKEAIQKLSQLPDGRQDELALNQKEREAIEESMSDIERFGL